MYCCLGIIRSPEYPSSRLTESPGQRGMKEAVDIVARLKLLLLKSL